MHNNVIFDSIKSLRGETQKQQQVTLTQEETVWFNNFFITIGKILADTLDPEGKKEKNRNGNSMVSIK